MSKWWFLVWFNCLVHDFIRCIIIVLLFICCWPFRHGLLSFLRFWLEFLAHFIQLFSLPPVSFQLLLYVFNILILNYWLIYSHFVCQVNSKGWLVRRRGCMTSFDCFVNFLLHLLERFLFVSVCLLVRLIWITLWLCLLRSHCLVKLLIRLRFINKRLINFFIGPIFI